MLAYMWIQIAVANSPDECVLWIETLDDLAARMSSEAITHAQWFAWEWRPAPEYRADAISNAILEMQRRLLRRMRRIWRIFP